MLISYTYVASSGNCARHSLSKTETPRSNKLPTLGAYNEPVFSMESPKERRDASNQVLNLCTASSTADSKKKKSEEKSFEKSFVAP